MQGTDTSQARAGRYPSALVLIHWVMALGITGLVISGLVMTSELLPADAKYRIFQTHKAFGVLMLLALVVRVCVRLTSFVPPLPFSQPKLEALATKWGHVALYGVMALMVGSGWFMVSSSPFGLPTSVFGWFNWPHIPGVPQNAEYSSTAKLVHKITAFTLIFVVLGHIAAVIKHRVIDEENILPRMWWAIGAVYWIGGFILIASLFILSLNYLSASAEPSLGSVQPIVEVANPTDLSNPVFVVDTDASAISFTGAHMETPFSGVFKTWQADIVFDPNNLAESMISATISLDSAVTGDSVYDGTLPEADWFDLANYPIATFQSNTIMALELNTYRVDGKLSLKAFVLPVSFDMILSDLRASPVTAKAEFALDRLAFDIGAGSDPDAEWVSRMISVNLNIVAMRSER